MTRYRVDIEPVDPKDRVIVIDQVFSYSHDGRGVFYVAGADFEHWFFLHRGQTVTVTEQIE